MKHERNWKWTILNANDEKNNKEIPLRCPEAKFGSYPEGVYADISLILSTVKMESIVYVYEPSPHC